MELALPPWLLVIDLEATCDERRGIPPAEMEIIEIGAVMVDANDLAITEELQTFVRPIRNRELTTFCTELTTITQADVDAAPLFPEALDRVRDFIGERDALFCSWGDYDRKQFEVDAARHGVELPFRGRHLNLKEQFSLQLGRRKRYGLRGALRYVGLELEGTHHRGIDDARNIARLLPWALGRAAHGAHFDKLRANGEQ